MVKTIIFLLVLLGVIIAIFAILTISYLVIDKKERQRKEKIKKSYENSITMCLKSRQAKVCPGVCSKCAWGWRKEYDEVVEFRGRR